MSAFVIGENLVAVGVLGRAAIHLLEVIFGLGLIGSAVVVIITFIEDVAEVFSNDEPVHSRTAHRNVEAEVASVR
jgi:multisubunit Na+/H+ antiporter MnhC subunit